MHEYFFFRVTMSGMFGGTVPAPATATATCAAILSPPPSPSMVKSMGDDGRMRVTFSKYTLWSRFPGDTGPRYFYRELSYASLGLAEEQATKLATYLNKEILIVFPGTTMTLRKHTPHYEHEDNGGELTFANRVFVAPLENVQRVIKL